MLIDVRFPGGLKVDAHLGGHSVHTDQRQQHGGDDTASPPFDLFLASIATCMGFYALRFCRQRDIDSTGLRLTLETEKNPETKMISVIRTHLQLPEGFPPKYVRAVERSMDQCTVKKHMLEPPRFETETEILVGP
jgi:ribosomal protein S12 methylthiotransferase accessory factor